MKVVIIGGVAGGATAAARIRRLDEYAQILIFERSGFVSYANCGLPYYVGGVITDQAELTLQTPERFWTRMRVEVFVRHEVTHVDPIRKVVCVHNLNTGEQFEESYDKLVLAPGAKPSQTELPGAELPEVFTLRTVEDALNIRSFVVQNKPKTAVLAGGGYISLELAENLRNLGIDVTVVQRPKQLLKPLDYEMACFVHAKMRQNGVKLLLGHAVKGFQHDENGGVRVLLDQAQPLHADLAVLAIGVTPDTVLARRAGLALDARGCILVNDRMEASLPDVYAVGDAVQVQNRVTNKPAHIPLAGPANRQARIAADNICGGDSHYRGSLGSSVIKLFDMTVATVGIREQDARQAGIDCDKVYLAPANHAGYYPGGRVMSMKVLFDKTSYQLLGAQIVGCEGVDKRIDVIATAMCAGLPAPELANLELAYAPPFSSAKDPVNVAGYIIQNIAYGRVRNAHWQDVDNLPRDGSCVLLDVRTEQEFAAGHVDGFMNIPLDELREKLLKLPPNRPVYVNCQSGLRSYLACRMLTQYGFVCYNISGGYRMRQCLLEEQCAAERAWPCGMQRD